MAVQERPAMRAICAIPKLSAPMNSWDWHLGGVEAPAVGPGQVLISVVAAGICRQDLSDLHFHERLTNLKAPAPFAYVPGSDVAGIVRSKAQDVKSLRVGDAVIALLDRTMGGGCAETVAVDVDRVWPKPSKICFAEAATLNMDGLCAVQAVESACRFMPMHEPNILITGPATGTGVLIAQVAKALYSAKITVVYKRESQKEIIDRLSVDEIIQLSEQEEISDKMAPAIFDVAFDTCGIAHKVAKLVKSGGLLLSTDGLPPKEVVRGWKIPGPVKAQMKQHNRNVGRACHGIGVTYEYIFPRYTQVSMQLLINLRDRGDVCPPYGPVFGLAKWHAGLQAAKEQVYGKVVFAVHENKSVYDKN